ncbi:MAG: DMT family transporter [Bacteriovoracaceae bacterium]|nr:DMT family transporter [Bacteriovoracaceae bacterium]
MKDVYLFAVGANLCFALGSQVYTLFSRKVGPVWMNLFKASLAFVAFAFTIVFATGWNQVQPLYVALLVFSGMIGLGIGDVFLLRSFSIMGPGRTLILFGFQPLILGSMGYLLFDQTVDIQKFWAITFFILCIATFSFEAFKKEGHWQMKGILMAFTGMLLDATGVVITRLSFDQNPDLTPLEGNFYRCFGAILVFVIWSFFKPINFIDTFKKLEIKEKWLAIGGSFLGTYLSLGLYLMALQKAHLASLSGIAITGTIFSSAFECIIAKKWPSRYLIIAFIFFLLGMRILVF